MIKFDQVLKSGTQSGTELDLLIVKNGKRTGYEFKYVDAPKVTPSMRIACEDLKLDHLYVVYPGKTAFPLSEKISARGLIDETKSAS